jgi:imidazolonepropionase-like amidohydrolase
MGQHASPRARLLLWTGTGVVTLLLAASCGGFGSDRFVQTNAPVIVLKHVRIIDGTGASPRDDQLLLIEHGQITALGDATRAELPPNTEILDLPGRTVIPGLVGMHEHLFYQLERPGSPTRAVAAQEAFARLYLAAGVTTIRTAGTIDFQGDLDIKRQIDNGSFPGPKIHITGPYLNALPGAPDPDRLAHDVATQADRGATSFKAYTSLRVPELRAAIQAAHDRGLKITGHLCAVGFREAAALGIDNLEHGLAVDTEFYSKKQLDECPPQGLVLGELAATEITNAAIQQAIRDLVQHGVAITSTLAVFESYTARGSALDPRVPALLAPNLQEDYRAARQVWTASHSPQVRIWTAILRKEMDFERQFVVAGGLLMAGADPTGWGGIVAGFGDQRELELLVQAGLSPEHAIKIATANGATFLNENTIGIVAKGKQADLVVVRGNPSVHIADVRNVELVFKDGVAYNPQKLISASEGTIGQSDWGQVLRWPFNLILGGVLLLILSHFIWRPKPKSAGKSYKSAGSENDNAGPNAHDSI